MFVPEFAVIFVRSAVHATVRALHHEHGAPVPVAEDPRIDPLAVFSDRVDRAPAFAGDYPPRRPGATRLGLLLGQHSQPRWVRPGSTHRAIPMLPISQACTPRTASWDCDHASWLLSQQRTRYRWCHPQQPVRPDTTPAQQEQRTHG